MTVPEITLNKAKEVLEQKKTKTFRASDFLTQEQVEEVHKSNIKGKKRSYNVVDAYVAEILARFGYDTYMAWKNGDISEKSMLAYVQAERAREIRSTLALESIIVASVAGSNHPTRHGSAPKSLKMAIDILKKEQTKAKGDF